MSSEDPIYPAVEPQLVKYEYDPRRAAQMIEGLGYTRGADGIFHDASGQRLAVEERATPGDLEVKIITSIRAYWQGAGVDSEAVPIPLQRQSDQEYRATRGSFELTRRGTSLNQLSSFRSSETPVPENGYLGGNISRYQSSEWDGLIERFFVTVPIPERTQVVAQVMRHVSDNLNMMHIFYDMDPLFVANRLVNVHGRQTESSPAWNISEWDVTS
jgi:peptide/nickel transport system substrate-binding protein